MTGARIEPGQRDGQVRRIIVIEGLANAAIVVVKLVVGLATGSFALIGDAIHSLSDVANNVIAWLVMRVSASPADREHPYGHRKFEFLAVFVLATLLVVLALELIITALTRAETEVVSHPIALAAMLATLGVNLGLAAWQRGWARRLDAEILHADASHTFADALTTAAAIVGWQLAAYGLPWLDRAAGVAVAGIVLWLAYSLFRRAVPTLVDETGADAAAIESTLAPLDGVHAVQRIRSRRMGLKLSIDLELAVDAGLSIGAADALRRDAASRLAARFGDVDVVIAVVPAAGDA